MSRGLCARKQGLHGCGPCDDFVFVGLDVDLDCTLEILQANYELKNRGRLGSGVEDTKEIDMLGRKLRWYDWGLTWQAGSRHKALLMEYFGMKDNVKVLSKKRIQGRSAKEWFEEQVLGKDEMKAFRMLAARLNYVAQDDPMIQLAAKELCRRMSSPTSQDFSKLKKLVRFPVGVKEVSWEYPCRMSGKQQRSKFRSTVIGLAASELADPHPEAAL